MKAPFPKVDCSQIQEAEVRAKCEQCQQAIAVGDLLASQGSSAYDLYQGLRQEPSFQKHLPTLKAQLGGAFQEEIQKLFDLSIRVPMEESSVLLVLNKSFDDYINYARKAQDLIEEDSEVLQSLRAQQFYLEGLALREKCHRLSALDTSLVNDAIRKQLEALKIDREMPQPYLELGELFLDFGAYGQSKNFFIQASEYATDWALPFIGLSRAFAREGDQRRALVLAKQAAEMKTYFGSGKLNQARILSRFNKNENSLQQYLLAIQELVDGLETQPMKYKLYGQFQLAKILSDFGMYPESESYLQPVLWERPIADATLLLGRIVDLAGNTLAADSIYRVCMATWPDQIEAFSAAGQLHQGLERYSQASQIYKVALKRSPEHREISYNQGLILHAFEDLDKVEKLYRQALVYPNGLMPVINKMDSLTQSGGFTRSLSSVDLTKLLEDFENPDKFFGLNFTLPARQPLSDYEDLIYANLGDLYNKLGRSTEAINMYKSALLLNPVQETSYDKLIKISMELDHYQDALNYIQMYYTYVPYSRENREKQKFTVRWLLK